MHHNAQAADLIRYAPSNKAFGHYEGLAALMLLREENGELQFWKPSVRSPLEDDYFDSQTLMVFMPVSASWRVLKATEPT